jgi:hypothetical protein
MLSPQLRCDEVISFCNGKIEELADQIVRIGESISYDADHEDDDGLTEIDYSGNEVGEVAMPDILEEDLYKLTDEERIAYWNYVRIREIAVGEE